jgi:hypothetical protein
VADTSGSVRLRYSKSSYDLSAGSLLLMKKEFQIEAGQTEFPPEEAQVYRQTNPVQT